MTSILRGKTTKDDTEVAIFTLRAISTDPPPHARYFLLLLAPYKPAPRCLPLVRGLYLAGDLGVENKALGRFFTWNNVCFVDIFRMNLIKREFCSFFEIRGKTFKSRLY